MQTAKTLFSPFRIVICFIALSLACGLALPRLKIDLLPLQKSSTLTVFYSLPNSSPDIVEMQMTSVIEGACSSLSQLKKINSASNYNSGYVQLQFDKSADMQFRHLELAAIIRRLYPQFPATASYPLITGDYGNDQEGGPMLIYYINAPLQPFQIRKEAESVFYKLFAEMNEVKQVKVSGAQLLQVTIRFDNTKCEAWHLQPGDIINCIQSYFAPGYPGSVKGGNGEEYFLHIPGPAASITAIENILIPVNNGSPIRLNDIAHVNIEEQEVEGYFRINGKNSVTLSIYAREGVNKMVVGQKVKTLIQQAQAKLPADEIRLAYDDTAFIEKEVSKNYRRTGLSMVILFVFILVFYRNWIYLVNLFSGLAVSLCLTIILVWVCGINIHLYTIAALAVSFGIIMDNIIVMLDYYHQWRNRKIFPALLAAALMTIMSLCMVFLLPEEEKKNLTDFSTLIILSMISSLVTMYWFMPGLYELTNKHRFSSTSGGASAPSYYNKKRILAVTSFYFGAIQQISRYRKSFIIIIVFVFGLPLFMLPSKWEGDGWYHHLYNNTIGSEVYQQHIRPYTDRWLGGSYCSFVNGVYAKSSYRSPEQTKLYIQARMPYGSSAVQVNIIFREIENYLSEVEGIDTYVTVIEGRSGNVCILFKEGFEKTVIPHQLKSELITRTIAKGGIEWDVYGIGQGFSNNDDQGTSGYRLIMKGYNYDELEKQARILKQKLVEQQRVQKADINKGPGFWEENSKQFVLHPDSFAMALYNTNRQEILNKLFYLSPPNAPAAQITIDNQYYPIVLKEINADKFSGYDLLHTRLSLDEKRVIDLNASGHPALENTVTAIYKEDRQYLRFVSFEYMGASEAGNNYLWKILDDMNRQMPLGYSIRQQETGRNANNSNGRYMLIVLLIGINFFIGSILFESLKKALYIICMIPISFIGIFLVFAPGYFYFDQGGYAAFVMLGGLVSNAAIYIVNDYNKLHKSKGAALHNKLLIHAIANRSRTLLLTIIATICGLIPFLVEGQQEVFWFSFALGTAGGLLFSVFALFVVLPVFLWNRNLQTTF